MRKPVAFFLVAVLFAPQGAFAAAPAAKPFFVRVLVAEERTYLDITAKDGAAFRLLPSGRIFQPKIKLQPARLVPTPNGFRLGNEELFCQAVIVEPARERELFLGESRFRGTVTIRKAKNGLMFAVNRLDIEG